MRTTDHRQNDRKTADELIKGYGQWVAQKYHSGHRVYLVTLQFGYVTGSPLKKTQIMMMEAERVWKFLAMRTVRKCRDASADELAWWFVVPDYPVAKYAKQPLGAVTINDGLHLHAIVVMPRQSRFGIRLSRHFRINQRAYLLPGKPLLRVHAKRVKTDHEGVVDYALKAIRSGRCSLDDIVIFPKACGEY